MVYLVLAAVFAAARPGATAVVVAAMALAGSLAALLVELRRPGALLRGYEEQQRTATAGRDRPYTRRDWALMLGASVALVVLIFI